jgi:hypothetical protein
MLVTYLYYSNIILRIHAKPNTFNYLTIQFSKIINPEYLL